MKQKRRRIYSVILLIRRNKERMLPLLPFIGKQKEKDVVAIFKMNKSYT